MSGSRVLEYDLSVGEDPADGDTVVVLLHGRGSHKGDLQALRPVLPGDWTLVTPQAPYAGAEWGYGPGWAWYRYVAEDRLVDETLTESLEKLERFLDGLPDVVGFEPGEVVLGGFSQGGTSSLAFSLTRPHRVKAALNFSGFLAASLDLPEGEGAASATPVFWGHGRRDPNIPHELAVRGRNRLKAAGVPLMAMDYPIGHWILPDEIHDAVSMIRSLE